MFTAVEQNGSILTSSGGQYTYWMSDGTVAIFLPAVRTNQQLWQCQRLMPSSVSYLDGKVRNFYYTTAQFIAAYTPRGPVYVYGRRLNG